LVGLTIGALLALGLFVVDGRSWLLLPPAFLAGVWLERCRRGPVRSRPLGELLSGLHTGVRESVGWPAALTACAVLGAAVAVLLRPAEGQPPPRQGAGVTGRPKPDPLPGIAVHRARPGREFRIADAAFRATAVVNADWARQIRRRTAGDGRRWVTIAVRARNLHRPDFDPTVLSYRLRDERRRLYAADAQGGTAPPSLARHGSLKHGEVARVQLGFRVPTRARRLTLVFEDRLFGPRQVRVPLWRRSG
jgi:hypothetical protein